MAATDTFSNRILEPLYDAKSARMLPVNLPASVTYVAGTILGELTAARGTYAAYATGNADGSQNAVCLLVEDCATDASGNITFGGSAAAGQGTSKCARAWFSGKFDTREILQSGAGSIDAGAVTKLGKLLQGTTAAGVLELT